MAEIAERHGLVQPIQLIRFFAHHIAGAPLIADFPYQLLHAFLPLRLCHGRRIHILLGQRQIRRRTCHFAGCGVDRQAEDIGGQRAHFLNQGFRGGVQLPIPQEPVRFKIGGQILPINGVRQQCDHVAVLLGA